MGLPEGSKTDGGARQQSQAPSPICFHGAPPAELWGPWQKQNRRMGT